MQKPSIKKDVEKKQLDRLYGAVLALKSKQECAAFFRDLCTLNELKAFAERFAIAELLAKDESYRGIADDTGASTTTVIRVAHWFKHGTGGYSTMINRMKK
jgi:TrpR-related protein YerC/YecD